MNLPSPTRSYAARCKPRFLGKRADAFGAGAARGSSPARRVSSGVVSLDEWLRRRAKSNQLSGATRTFVLCDDDRVIAYYALTSSAVAADAAAGKFKRNMPDPIPVVVLARLAISEDRQGAGIGRALFQDAARRVMNAAGEIGIRGMRVHAISVEAAAFYRRLGLAPSPLDPMTLMVTLADLRASIDG